VLVGDRDIVDLVPLPPFTVLARGQHLPRDGPTPSLSFVQRSNLLSPSPGLFEGNLDLGGELPNLFY